VNRALRAATMGALLLAPVALGACSAGQVTQTASQNRDKVGVLAEVEHITLRQVQIAYPEDEAYAAGDDADLVMAIINDSSEEDTLVSIEGEGFDGVLVEGDAAAGPATPATPATPGAPARPTPGSDVDLPIPAGSPVYVGEDGDVQIALADLAEPLTVGQSLELTLTFERAGETTVRAIVATPDESLERGEAFDFHEEEGETGGESAREDESGSGGGPGSNED
jgi:copper(I)-binding protein